MLATKRFERDRFVLAASLTIALVAFLVISLGLTSTGECQTKNTLWQVRSGEKTVFLLGSIHFLNKASYPLSPAIERAFQASDRIVLEIDLQSNTAAATQELALQRGIYLDGTMLRDHLSVEAYDSAQRHLRQQGLEIESLGPLKPWLLAFTVLAVKLQRLGFDPNYGVDHYFAQRAREAAKGSGGLETVEFQIGLVDSLSAREQEALLLQTLKEVDTLEATLNTVVRAWREGDIARLEAFLHADKTEFPEVHEKLVVARNRRWLPQIESMIKQGGNVFVIVGAAHLIGTEGVIELLKQRGYKVEQL